MMTNRKILFIASVIALVLSFNLQNELLSLGLLCTTLYYYQPSANEKADMERQSCARQIAFSQEEAYVTELAKRMAKREADSLEGKKPKTDNRTYTDKWNYQASEKEVYEVHKDDDHVH